MSSALSYLSKKSWHTANVKNREKVWKHEQAEKDEARKLVELRKQLDEERERERLMELQDRAGIKSRDVKTKEKLNWMYQGPAADAQADDLLLGKTEADLSKLQQQQQDAQGSGVAAKVDAPHWERSNPVSEANEEFHRIHEDPMFAIQQKAFQMKQAARAVSPERQRGSKRERNSEKKHKRSKDSKRKKSSKRKKHKTSKSKKKKSSSSKKRRRRKHRSRSSSDDSSSEDSMSSDSSEAPSSRRSRKRSTTTSQEGAHVKLAGYGLDRETNSSGAIGPTADMFAKRADYLAKKKIKSESDTKPAMGSSGDRRPLDAEAKRRRLLEMQREGQKDVALSKEQIEANRKEREAEVGANQGNGRGQDAPPPEFLQAANRSIAATLESRTRKHR